MTIAELLGAGLRLAVQCPDCARFRYLRAERQDPAADIAGLVLSCDGCGSGAARAVVVERDAKRGVWPAESSR